MYLLRHRKRVLRQLIPREGAGEELKLRPSAEQIDGDHVEPGSNAWPLGLWEASQISACELAKSAALVLVHSRFSRCDMVSGTCFDLDEAEAIILPGNEVDISPVSGGGPADCDNGVPATAKLKECGPLPKQTGLEVSSNGRPRKAG